MKMDFIIAISRCWGISPAMQTLFERFPSGIPFWDRNKFFEVFSPQIYHLHWMMLYIILNKPIFNS